MATTDKRRRRTAGLAKALLPQSRDALIEQLQFNDTGFGYDRFGMERETAILAYALMRPMYKNYFRVESSGHENIPDGKAILAVNHSGALPYDAMMVAIDIIEQLRPPRIMRGIVEYFAARLPYLSVFFNRVGQVTGTRRNFAELLADDQLVGVFPEGAKGLGKLYRDRYNLVPFNVGFVELSLKHKSPIVPVAVVGAEEQMPMISQGKRLAKLMRSPYLPITPLFPALGPLGLLPLPVKYHIYYGEPRHFYKEYGEDSVTDARLVRSLADIVQEDVQSLINRGLEERQGIFR